jgi:branched-chain amino acid transport system permease protein
MKRYSLFVVLLFIWLAACSPVKKNVTAVSTPTIPEERYDGQWQGSGKTRDGLPFTIFFTIKNSALSGVYYWFDSPTNAACGDIVHRNIEATQRPHISDKSDISAPLGADLNLAAVFQDDSSASGHLSGTLSNYRDASCNITIEADWSATKLVAQTPVAQPAASRTQAFETLLQILVFGLSNGAVLALNAIGVTIIYSTVRTFNLAHGDVFALTTVIVTSLVNGIGIQNNWTPLQLIGALIVVFSAAVLAGAFLSMGVNQLAFKPFRGYSRLAPLIATLGLSFILYQAALVWRTFQASWIPGEHRSAPGLPEIPTDGIPSLLPEINLVKVFHLPSNHLVIRLSDVFVLLMAFVFVALATWFLQRTNTGRAIRAYSQNQILAQILGVNIDQTIQRAFAFGGALAGAAAFIFALYYARPFGVHGAQSGLLAFAAALLGGIGSPLGALLSGLFIGMVSSVSDYYLSARWTSVLLLSLLIGLLVWRPTGLTSSEEAESPVVRDSVILTAPGESQGWNRWLIFMLTVLAVLPILLQVFGLGGLSILRTIGIFILLTLGLNLALGVSGLLDFGLALSYGMGAYTTAILSKSVGFLPALLGGVAAAALTGVIKGAVGWRLRGDHLAVATLALGLAGRQVIVNLGSLTGGVGGLANFPQPSLLGFSFITPTAKYFLVFVVIIIAAWASQRLIASRSGRAWIAASEDELAASSVGVNVGRSRLLTFVLSSALAGLAGSLFASTYSFAEPDMLAFHITTFALTMVILGGAGSISGPIIGAATIILLDKVFVPQLANWIALIWPKNFFIGAAPDIRGASFFNFGIALYLTVLLRARRKTQRSDEVER